MIVRFDKLRVLEPLIDSAFQRFYDEILSDEVFSVFFSGPDAVYALIERQKKNFIESLACNPEDFEARFRQIGLLHYRLKIPYIDFIKGTSILKESFVRLIIDDEKYIELVGLLYEYFRVSMSFMAKGYLEAMIETDKHDIGFLIEQYESIPGDEQELALAQLRWLLNVLIAVERGKEGDIEALQQENLAIHRRFQQLTLDSSAGGVFASGEHLDGLHERLLRDTQSLFYFLKQGSYADVLPIYTGLLSIYKVSLFLLSNLVISVRLEETRRDLQRTEEKYRQVVENSTDAIFLSDADGRIQFANPAVQEIFGYSPEAFMTDPGLPERIVRPDYRQKHAARSKQLPANIPPAGKPVEWAWIHKDGRNIFTENTSTAIRDEQGTLIGIQTIVRDITERKQVSLALEQAKEAAERANQAKSIFLANMSHELRTPLNALLGFSQMLARDCQADSEQKEKLIIINRSGEHLLTMINDVLDLSKIEAGRVEMEPEAFDLPVMLEDIGRMFKVRAENADLHFALEIEPSSSRYIKADAGKLRQVLINLLGNAVKFTREGGFSLRARTRPMQDNPAMCFLQLEVHDSGPGILPQQQQHIFQAFAQAGHRSPTKGTGLGLAISKSFVELMGGDIRVDSEPGKGTLFRIELPVVLAEASETRSTETAKPEVLALESGQPAWRILVVEDNPENRMLLIDLLARVGFETQAAENGEQAVTLFQAWQPHFIWMDMRMPVMDGFEATPRIRALPHGDQVKIVALTASVFKERRKKILQAGCDGVVHKPFQAHEIFETMGGQLGVRYRYTEASEEAAGVPVEITAEAIAALPEALRESLRIIALSLRQEEFEATLVSVRERDPALAEGLAVLSREFRYDRILELLAAHNK